MIIEAQKQIFGLPIERWQSCPDGTELYRVGLVKQAILDAMRLPYIKLVKVVDGQTIEGVAQIVELPRDLPKDPHLYRRERSTFVGDDINAQRFSINKGFFVTQKIRYR